MNEQESYESAAANLQIEYDIAVHMHGSDSWQAKAAELVAKQFFNTTNTESTHVHSNHDSRE